MLVSWAGVVSVPRDHSAVKPASWAGVVAVPGEHSAAKPALDGQDALYVASHFSRVGACLAGARAWPLFCSLIPNGAGLASMPGFVFSELAEQAPARSAPRAPRLPLPWPWPWRASSYESPSFDALPRISGGPPQRRAIAIHRMAPIEKPRLNKLPRNYLPFGKMYCQLFTAYTGLDDIILPLARKAQLRD